MTAQNTTVITDERRQNDRVLWWILLAHVPVVGLLVPQGYGTAGFALPAAIGLGVLVTIGYWFLRGQRQFSALAGLSLMVFSAIMIQAQLGRIEMHFHIFVALAFLLIYRDWLPILVAAGTIAVHHYLLTALQLNEVVLGGLPVMIFDYGCDWGITTLHAVFVVIEAGVLLYYAHRLETERRVTREIIATVARFREEQDLSQRLKTPDKSGTVEAFNDLLDQFGLLVKTLAETGGSLDSAAGRLGELSTQANQTLNEQRDQANAVASATTELNASIGEVAERANLASEAASDADEQARQGRGHVEEAIRQAETNHETLSASMQTIDALTATVGEISKVVVAIREISDQTNLLALNASIEAARAGEHGRGFAVVAEEVRSLSKRTHQSTEDIRGMIERLDAATREAVQAFEQGQNHARQTRDTVQESGQALERIAEAVARLDEMNREIAAAAEQQAEAAGEIDRNVNRIVAQNDAVVEVGANVQSQANTLGELVAGVRDLGSRYRL